MAFNIYAAMVIVSIIMLVMLVVVGRKQNSGIDIPLEARIMALADVFDALVSKRCYKEKMDYDRAFIIIEESLGSHFDPELGKRFIKCREHLEKYYDEMEN